MRQKLPRHTREESIEMINSLGRDKIPFHFLISFDMERNCIIPASEAAARGLIIEMTPGKQEEDEAPGKLVFEKEGISRDRYRKAFSWVKDQILYGNSFLLNLTFQTRISCNFSLEEIFRYSRAPYRLLLEDELVVFSPERFIRIQDNMVFSNPMKGTLDASLPDAHARLSSDKKEDAEHNTIVDLIRNDLSMIASDVRVNRFKYIEEVRTHRGALLQMSSEISGRLPDAFESRLGEILFALLPAGSVTGAPKQKTVEIIQKAEGYDRAYFTGIFGCWDGNKLDSAVAIRYIEKDKKGLLFKSGGGITFQSQWEQEYEEMLDKVYVPIY